MKIILLFVFHLVFFAQIFGQKITAELISTAGDKFVNNTYQLDWSIGEIQIETYSNTSNIQTQGFHQSGNLPELLKSLEALPFEITISPNPTHSQIYLEVHGELLEYLEFNITNAFGVILNSDKITAVHQEINLENYNTGTYILSILMNNQLLMSFKIIKN